MTLSPHRALTPPGTALALPSRKSLIPTGFCLADVESCPCQENQNFPNSSAQGEQHQNRPSMAMEVPDRSSPNSEMSRKSKKLSCSTSELCHYHDIRNNSIIHHPSTAASLRQIHFQGCSGIVFQNFGFIPK